MKYLSYLQFLPLTAFIITARAYGMTDIAWEYAFYVGTVLTIVETAFLIYKKVLLGRFILAVNLFLSIGGVAFFLRWYPLLEFYGQYQHVVLFASVVAVGLVTTFFSEAGFIGIENKNPAAIRRASLYLLGASVIALIISIAIQVYGLITAAILFILLRVFSSYLAR